MRRTAVRCPGDRRQRSVRLLGLRLRLLGRDDSQHTQLRDDALRVDGGLSNQWLRDRLGIAGVSELIAAILETLGVLDE
jgi:hypothetical protein